MIAFEKSVGAVVFRKTEEGIRFLLLDYGDTYWSFAKGHVEEGETEEETMRREIREETGIIDLKIIPEFRAGSRYTYRAKGKEKEERKKSGRKTTIVKTVKYFLAETGTRKVTISHEHRGFEWLPYGEALARITYKNSKKVLEKAKRFLDPN